MIATGRRKHHWLTVLSAVLVFLGIAATTALVLIEEFMPGQKFLSANLVSMPRRVITETLAPLQRALSWAGSRIQNAAQTWQFRRMLEAEYTRLVSENERLVYQSLLNDTLEAENARLNALIGEYRARETMHPVMARVVSKESGNWFSMFDIDKGEDDGLELGMAVINQDGLIGIIYRMTPRTASVVSIIDSRSSIGAMIQTTSDQGIIKGTLGVEQSATCRMYYLPADSVPRPGDPVVTSGVTTTGVEQASVAEHMPRGLKIGVVRESTRHMDENKNYIVVEPNVDFMHIEEVLVLVYKADPETMPVADDGQMGYTPADLDSYRPVPTIGKGDVESAGATATPIVRPSRMPAATPGPGETLDPGAGVDPDDLNYLDPDEQGPEDAGDGGDSPPPVDPDDLNYLDPDEPGPGDLEAGVT